MPALRVFKDIHGHADVPTAFVVPRGDEAWPELTWGWKLGNTAKDIRSTGAYAPFVARSRDELDRMQFCYDMSVAERDWTYKVLPSLRVYYQVFGHCLVERHFQVPATSPWPRKAWGMQLGVTVQNIRTGRSYEEQVARDKETLTALGFAMDYHAAVWEQQLVPALQMYAAQFGHCRVPTAFVVPAEHPWPPSSWGMKLGATLATIRKTGSYFAFIGRDADKLDDLGVDLTLSARAWKKHVTPLLDTYSLLFSDKLPAQDFIIPSEAPWPHKMWSVRLGRIVALNSRHV